MKNNNLCFMMVVDHRYVHYVPWFIFFLSRSYPEYAVRIYSTCELPDSTKKALSPLDGVSDWTIHENYFSKYARDPFSLKSLRWLIYPSDVQPFENVYIGDIDMLICRESTTILDYHLERCQKLNMPYSNRVRGDKCDMRDGDSRMLGVHFATKQWFHETKQLRDKYIDMASRGNLRAAVKTESNEGLLYLLAKQTTGLPPTEKPFYEYHGIHLGIWRDKIRHNPDILLKRKKYTQQIIPVQYMDYYSQYQEAKKTNTFKAIWGNTPSIHYIFEQMEIFSNFFMANYKKYY